MIAGREEHGVRGIGRKEVKKERKKERVEERVINILAFACYGLKTHLF